MKYNDDNMLMIDFDEVSEQDWDDAVDALMDDDEYLDSYQKTLDAMHEPEIDVSGNASSRQEKLIRDINFVLNGSSHKLDCPVFIKCIDGGEMQCEKVLYRDGKLWAEEYDFDHDFWEQQNLVGVCEDSLEKLYEILIDEIF